MICALMTSSIAAILAQGGFNPFQGTNCTCDLYCAGSCAANATGAQNLTLYRMTPYGVFFTQKT
jgi:hypothetical protein